jgi:hypothetical protein
MESTSEAIGGFFFLPRFFVAIVTIFCRYLPCFFIANMESTSQYSGGVFTLARFFVTTATIFSWKEDVPLFRMMTRGDLILLLFPRITNAWI